MGFLFDLNCGVEKSRSARHSLKVLNLSNFSTRDVSGR